MFGALKTTKLPADEYSLAGRVGSDQIRRYGPQESEQAYLSLLDLLKGRGRVDPRLLARAQALNARSTQQRMDAARAGAAGTGFSGGGLNRAVQEAIASSGRTQASNLNYQDIADSYGRNQQNLGLYDQLVMQPSINYADLGLRRSLGLLSERNRQKDAILGFSSGLFKAAGQAAGG